MGTGNAAVLQCHTRAASIDFSTKAQNTKWKSDFAFATDIIQKINELNEELQGKGVFAHNLYLKVKSFQTKLTLFAK